MAYQYYKIISLQGEMDIVEKGFHQISLNDTSIKNEPATDHSKFTHILQRCLDTDHLISVCKQLQLKDIHPTKMTDTLFLGYSEAFISVKLTQKVRETLYQNGFVYKNKKYVRYKRSANSAKDGKCLFILSALKEEMEQWSNCGLNFAQGTTSELTSWEAYTALTLSGIQETFSLPRKCILLVNDLDSNFKTSGIEVYLNENKQLDSAYKDEIEISNKIWDGECLIDESLFDELSPNFSGKHMLLLRNRFFKSCGFKTKLQKWFKDNGINDPSKLNGFTTAKKIEDIKLVITESSLKYLKFYQGDTEEVADLKKALQSWFEGLGNSQKLTFGIVKSDSPSRYWEGQMVHTNYQLLNTLGLKEQEAIALVKPTIDYIENAKNDPAYFKHFLQHSLTFSTSAEDTINQDSDPNSIDSSYFRHDNLYYYKEKLVENLLTLSNDAFHSKICKTVRNRRMAQIKKSIAIGRFLIPGTYATLFGNPIELLISIITPGYTLPAKPTVVQVVSEGKKVQYPTLVDNEVYSTLFEEGAELCGVRSPHITMGNLFLCKNTQLNNNEGKSFIREYFDLSPQIICVNAINHNLLQRLNGADFDSDMILITNHPIIVAGVKRQRDLFPVPINHTEINMTMQNVQVFKSDSERLNRLIEIDNKIANNIIGKIVNLSQLLNSVLWTRFPNLCVDDYLDNPYFQEDFISYTYDFLYRAICELEVLSNIEIDKAKRCYLEDPSAEYRRLSDLLKPYQMRALNEGHIIESRPDYLAALQKTKQAQNHFNLSTVSKKVKWSGLVFDVKDRSNHQTTMKYIYDYVMNHVAFAPKEDTVPFSSLISPVEGKRSHVDVFNRLKIITAYYYIKIRSSNYVNHSGVKQPDYNKCSSYIEACYQSIEQILNSAKDANFVIYSIIKDIDDSSGKQNSPFIVNNIVKTICTWKNKRKYTKSSELVQLVTAVSVSNRQNPHSKKNMWVFESYENLLLSALFNAKDSSNNYLLREMIKNNQSAPVETLHFNNMKGNDYIYNYRFERRSL